MNAVCELIKEGLLVCDVVTEVWQMLYDVTFALQEVTWQRDQDGAGTSDNSSPASTGTLLVLTIKDCWDTYTCSFIAAHNLIFLPLYFVYCFSQKHQKLTYIFEALLWNNDLSQGQEVDRGFRQGRVVWIYWCYSWLRTNHAVWKKQVTSSNVGFVTSQKHLSLFE